MRRIVRKTMSERRRSRKRGKSIEENNEDSSTNILTYKRGQSASVPEKDTRTRQNKQRLIGSGKIGIRPTCCDFGPDRLKLYPGFFFCKQCDNWDNRPIESQKVKKTSKKYK